MDFSLPLLSTTGTLVTATGENLRCIFDTVVGDVGDEGGDEGNVDVLDVHDADCIMEIQHLQSLPPAGQQSTDSRQYPAGEVQSDVHDPSLLGERL